MVVNPTGIASCHGTPGAHGRHHELGEAGEWSHMGRATGPPQPETHIQATPVAALATTLPLPHLAPAQSLQSSASRSQIPPNLTAPSVKWPKCSKIC